MNGISDEYIKRRMAELRVEYMDPEAALLRIVELEHKLKGCRNRLVELGEREGGQ
ncbi:MAG: hypothetical protein ACTSX8_00750 [Alphaproteobacteria bacterium]